MPPNPQQNAKALEAIAQQPIHLPQLMVSQPGITRDGTRLQHPTYIDGQWMRFWQDKPRKMLGYREQVRDVDGIARNISVFNSGGYCYVHTGSTEAFQRYAIELVSGANTTLIDRTPAAYAPDPQTLWSSDVIFMTGGTDSTIFAAPIPALGDITSTEEVAVYYGDATDPAILVPALDSGTSAPIVTSGGLVAVGPYLLLYGANGIISWNVAGVPLNRAGAGSGQSRPVADKIVKGMPLRGNAAPAALFWSLSSLIVGNFVGGTSFWSFNTISTNGSILSSNCVIEHNGIYYWAHTSGFSMFSGVMQDIPNEYNQQFFLDNLNFSQRQKVFAVKVPRFKEIWWCFPRGTSTECNHAVIYKYDKGYWYDTPLPNGGRAAGYYDVTYNYPIMSGVEVNGDTQGTSMWQHEFGLDEVSGAQPLAKAIKSYYRTHEFNLPVAPAGRQGDNRQLSFAFLEPDFNQVGDLTVQIYSRANARAPETSPEDGPFDIEEVPATSNEQLVDMKWTGRLTSFQIESNVAGGDYKAGSPLLHLKPSEGRMTE